MATQKITINEETTDACCGGGSCACSAEAVEKVETVEAKAGCDCCSN